MFIKSDISSKPIRRCYSTIQPIATLLLGHVDLQEICPISYGYSGFNLRRDASVEYAEYKWCKWDITQSTMRGA